MRSMTLMALALAVLTGPVSAQPETDSDPLYHVEIIIFGNDFGDRAEEDFHHGPVNVPLDGGRRLLRLPAIELESVFATDTSEEPEPIPSTDAAEPPGTPPGSPELPAGDRLELVESALTAGNGRFTGAATPPPGFRPLTAAELELGNVRAAFPRSAYTVLAHTGWAQSGIDENRSVPLDLKRVGITNPAGTIRVWLGRFLHAAVDLEYFDGTGSLWTFGDAPGLAPLERAEGFRLVDETDPMYSGDLHFIDHPMFGVLIRITPAPPPEPEDGTEPTGRPIG